MTSLLLRLGLWGLVILLGLMIVADAAPEGPLGMLADTTVLWLLLKLVGVVFLLGLISLAFEKIHLNKSKCKTCGVKVPKGYIYCRHHLTNLVEREDQKSRTLTNVPTPDTSQYEQD